MIRLHHDGDDGYRNTQPETPFCLLVDECPIARPALCILFGLRWVIERELDVVERSQFLVFQNRNTMTVGSDGELDRFRSQVRQYSLEAGMHAVLAGAKIHRAHGQAFHDCLHLIQRETIRASRIAVAKGAGEITLVGQAEPERNTGIARHARSGRRRPGYVVHAPSFITESARCAIQCV